MTTLILGIVFGVMANAYYDWHQYRRELEKLEEELNNDRRNY
jgi:hypothetical protein